MITKNPLNNDNYSVLQQIEAENNLTEIQIQRGVMGYFPIFISLGITLFGLFGFIAGLTTNQLYIYLGLAFAGLLILFIESQRTALLVDFYSSSLESKVNDESKKNLFGMFIALVFTVVFIGLDMFGANSMSIYVKQQMIENKVVNSKAYQLAEAEAKNGTKLQNIHLNQMKDWRKAQRMAMFTCERMPKNYITKKMQCRREWSENNPMPKQKDIKSSGDVGFNDFSKMEDEAKLDLNNYDTYFYYAFFVLSLLLNYLAVSSVFNQYRAKSKELSGDMIEVLRDRFEAMQTEKLNKMRGSNNAIESKLKEFYDISVELEKEDYNLSISRKNNILQNRRNTINNIEYVETYPSAKAGFIDISKTESNNATKDFSKEQLEIVTLLWEDVREIGDPLKRREDILRKIGNTRKNTALCSTVYKKITQYGMAYRKGGYISRVLL